MGLKEDTDDVNVQLNNIFHDILRVRMNQAPQVCSKEFTLEPFKIVDEEGQVHREEERNLSHVEGNLKIYQWNN